MYKLFLVFLLSISTLYANSYTLYVASSKYLDVIKKYFFETVILIPNENIIIRTHLKGDYSLIINNIKTIEKAKDLQIFLKKNSTYKDTYIKKFDKEPKYSIIYMSDKEVIVNKVEENPQENNEFIQDIENSNEYISASTMYNIGEYKKAYSKFFKLFIKHNDNLNINYFLALSAIKIGLIDEATAALERVLIIKPSFNQARLIYAKLLHKLKLKSLAKKEYETLSKANITPKSKKLVNKYLEELNKKPKTNFINGSIMVGVGRNSNVNNGVESNEYKLPGLNNIIVSSEKPIIDNFHNEAFSLNFINTKKDLAIKNSFLVFNKNYFNEKDQNMTVFSYKPSILFSDKKNNQIYSLNFEATRIKKEVNDFDSFSLSTDLASRLIYLSLKYQRVLYLSTNNKDKNYNNYALFLKYNFLKNLSVYSKLSKNSSIYNSRNDIDKLAYSSGFEYIYLINKKNMIKLSSQFTVNKYMDYNPLFESKRKDNNFLISMVYLNKFSENNQILFSMSYVDNDSNQDPYIYEEIEGKINFIKSFNF